MRVIQNGTRPKLDRNVDIPTLASSVHTEGFSYVSMETTCVRVCLCYARCAKALVSMDTQFFIIKQLTHSSFGVFPTQINKKMFF